MTNREIKGKNRKISSNFLILLQNKNKTMDRETIEKAALEHALNTTGLDYIEEVASENGFIAGAEWRINSVWHDASEKPKFNGKVEKEGILLLYSSGQCVFLYLDKDEWESILGYATFVKWAYITDLIPDARKEVQP